MTSFGINNNGHLVFDYYHEDYGDNGVSGQLDVYNGKDSVLWVNFSQAFADEIKTTYSAWRSGSNPLLSYDKIIENFITNHSDRWSISIYNEDAEYKYISMYRNGEDKGDQYLYQVRGTGEEHLKYFVKNRLMYCDSKWQAGDFVNKDSNTIILRINSPIVDAAYPHLQPRTKIKYTTFSNMYAGVGYGAKAGVTHSAYVKKGQPVKFARGANFPDWYVGQELQTDEIIEYESKLYKVLQSHIAHESRTPDVASSFFEFIEVVREDGGQNDLDTYIFGANEVSSLDDLSLLYCGDINISAASKLTTLIIGNSAEGYTNSNLKSLSLSNNRLLRILDVSNCTELKTTLDFTLCPDIQEIYAKGSGITGIILPSSGFLKKIHLPKIGSLIITNQHRIEEFECEGYEKLTTLNIENATMVERIDENTTSPTDRFPLQEILMGCDINNIIDIKIKNVKWDVDSEDTLRIIIDKLSSKQGIILEGSVYLPGDIIVSDELKEDAHAAFPNLNIIDKNPVFYVDYYTYNNQFWDTEAVHKGQSAQGPKRGNPEHEIDEARGFKHLFIGWDNLPVDVQQNCRVSAKWQTQYAVSFYNDDGSARYDVLYYNVDESPDDPVEYGVFEGELPAGKIYEPTKTSSTPDTLQYKFNGWALEPNSSDSLDTLPVITGVTNFYATFIEQYPVKFYETSEGDSKQIQYGDTQWIIKGQDAILPATNPTKASTAEFEYRFLGWVGDYTNVIEPRNIYANYEPIRRSYNVYFYNPGELDAEGKLVVKYKTTVLYGNTVTYRGDKNLVKHGVEAEDVEKYTFVGWSPLVDLPVTGETNYYALFKFTAELKDSWDTIANNAALAKANDGYLPVNNVSADTEGKYYIKQGNRYQEVVLPNDYVDGVEYYMHLSDYYPLGSRKSTTFTIEGKEITAEMEVIAYEHDYLNVDGTDRASLTFFCRSLPNIQRQMHSSAWSDSAGSGGNVGGYSNSDIRTKFLNAILYNALEESLHQAIKPVYKYSDGGYLNKQLVQTQDYCWLASYDEIFTRPYSYKLSGQGDHYSKTFIDKQACQKFLYGSAEASEYARSWWLRSSYCDSGYSYLHVRSDGDGVYMTNAITSSGPYVAFGFCI